jgi:uncharacterized protein (TIGR02757 family)
MSSRKDIDPGSICMTDTHNRYYERLEELYHSYNRREYISPDPIQFLHCYDDPRDREVAGIVASSLAYGRVAQIVKSVSRVLDVMGKHPMHFLTESTPETLSTAFMGFVHRFTTERELVLTLGGMGDLVRCYGSLEAVFMDGYRTEEATVFGALERFAEKINRPFDGGYNSLIPYHTGKSAMKRLNLYLRWMVRLDEVDPGGWVGISPSRLVAPLDTHLFRIGTGLGFTERLSADRTTALEITGGFSRVNRDDPVKYDFALTRLGIWEGLRMEGKNLDLLFKRGGDRH